MTGGWRESALCAQVDPALWFPSKNSPGLQAKRICRRCPVIAPCLEDALATEPVDARFGVRGGLGPTERRDLTHKIRNETRRAMPDTTPSRLLGWANALRRIAADYDEITVAAGIADAATVMAERARAEARAAFAGRSRLPGKAVVHAGAGPVACGRWTASLVPAADSEPVSCHHCLTVTARFEEAVDA